MKPALIEGADPEGYRCEAALECIPLTYEIDEERAFGQYKWFFSADEWRTVRQDLDSEDADPEFYRCESNTIVPANCIPQDYVIKEDRGVWQYSYYFAESMWITLMPAFKDGTEDPDDFRCQDN